MTVWFTSDTHYGHGGARGLFKRPFATTDEMDEAMIARWNAVVRPQDAVWHLGDVAVRQSQARVAEILSRLVGEKHLITGNNDSEAALDQLEWVSVQSYAELELDGHFLVLCHYPFRSWNRQHKGAINLHGHSHGNLKPLARQVDVGVDAWAFRPVRLQDILAKARLG